MVEVVLVVEVVVEVVVMEVVEMVEVTKPRMREQNKTEQTPITIFLLSLNRILLRQIQVCLSYHLLEVLVLALSTSTSRDSVPVVREPGCKSDVPR